MRLSRGWLRERLQLDPFGPRWVDDREREACVRCAAAFGVVRRRHHCRCCGEVFCAACCADRMPIHPLLEVCDRPGMAKGTESKRRGEARVCMQCKARLAQIPQLVRWVKRHLLGAPQRFIRDMEQHYGQEIPQFFYGQFNEAMSCSVALRKPLLVYIHSFDHDGAQRFCKDVLCSPQVRSILDQHVVVFGKLAQDFEYVEHGGMLTVFSPQQLPVLAVMAKLDGTAQELARSIGYIDVDSFTAFMDDAMQTHAAALENTIGKVLQQQEEDYAKALEEDLKHTEKSQTPSVTTHSLPEEPASAEIHVAILIRMSDGSQLQRRFLPTDNMATVYDVVQQSRSRGCPVQLVSHYPRFVFPNTEETLEQLGVCGRVVVFAEDTG